MVARRTGLPELSECFAMMDVCPHRRHMEDIPACLRFLALPYDADERSIRRAYARRLKQLDQQTEAAAFQQLREAYEGALQWARNSPTPVEACPACPDEPVAPTVPDSATLAATVLGAALAELLANGPLQPEPVQELLRATLTSAAMVELDTRAAFEALVAERLVLGWQPGHEVLFPAAVTVFGWMEEHRLRRFDGMEEVLRRAIGQDVDFHRQGSWDIIGQRRLLTKLRAADLPEQKEMIDLFPSFEYLSLYLPDWLAVMAPHDHILRWREHYTHVLQRAPGSSLRRSRRASAAESPLASMLPEVLCLLLVLFLLLQHFSG